MPWSSSKAADCNVFFIPTAFQIEEAGSAIQGHVGGGDTLHVMCKNEKSKKKVA